MWRCRGRSQSNKNKVLSKKTLKASRIQRKGASHESRHSESSDRHARAARLATYESRKVLLDRGRRDHLVCLTKSRRQWGAKPYEKPKTQRSTVCDLLRVSFRWAHGNGVLCKVSPDPSNPVDLGEGPLRRCKRSPPNTKPHEADALIRAFSTVVGTSLLDSARLISPS